MDWFVRCCLLKLELATRPDCSFSGMICIAWVTYGFIVQLTREAIDIGVTAVGQSLFSQSVLSVT